MPSEPFDVEHEDCCGYMVMFCICEKGHIGPHLTRELTEAELTGMELVERSSDEEVG